MATAQNNMICAVCTEVYRSPRFLPCHHSFCLKCLEQLANNHGSVIPCPLCRAPAKAPAGGVRNLQVNFYFTEEELEQARSEARSSMCPVHAKESAIFYCTQCEEAICIRCSSSVWRNCGHGRNMERRGSKGTTGSLRQSGEKSGRCYTASTRRALDALLQLHERVRQALSTTVCDTEVLQAEKDMTQGTRSKEWVRAEKAGKAELPDMTYRPGLHGGFSNSIEDEIKRYIGSPVELTFKSHNEVEIVRIGRCRDEECQEVFALREKEDRTIQVLYGLAGDFSKPKKVDFWPDGSRGKETQLESKYAFVSRKEFYWTWNSPCWRQFGSKGDSMFLLQHNCQSGVSDIFPLEFKTENGKQTCKVGLKLLEPKVCKVHKFDSNKCGSLFAVIDEDEEESSTKKSEKRTK